MPTNPQTLLDEAKCFSCFSNASLSDMLELALLDRISQAASSDVTPGLPLTSVQFNDGGVFGGDADFTWNKTTNLLSITGGIALTGEANETQIAVTGYSLTGANAQSMLSLAGTWNTTGTPTAVDLNITVTAANNSSRFFHIHDGATNYFSVDRFNVSITPTVIGTSANFGTGMVSPSLTAAGNNSTLTFQSRTFAVAGTAVDILANAADSTATSGQYNGVAITPVYNQAASTASNTDLLVNRTQTSIGSGSQFLIDLQVGGSTRFNVTNTGIFRSQPAFTVATLPAAGNAGSRAYVTDATAPVFLGALVGGGAVVTPVFDNGAAWVSA